MGFDLRICAEVEEELEEGEADDKGRGAQGVELAREDPDCKNRSAAATDISQKPAQKIRTEQSGEKEALNLDPLAAQLLDGEYGDVVPGDEAQGGDDEVADRDLEEALPGLAALAVEADLLQHDVLVQVDAVEGDVEQEPARTGADEQLGVLPLGEVVDELCDSVSACIRWEGKRAYP